MKHTRESIKSYIAECREKGTLINLSFLDLSELDLSGLDLSCANLRWADLSWANLRMANLRMADLRMANLRGANLSVADLRMANLDFASLPPWCGSFDIICDKGLISQLLYHLCRLDVKDCPEWDSLRNNPELIALANQSHVIETHSLPKIEEMNNA